MRSPEALYWGNKGWTMSPIRRATRVAATIEAPLCTALFLVAWRVPRWDESTLGVALYAYHFIALLLLTLPGFLIWGHEGVPYFEANGTKSLMDVVFGALLIGGTYVVQVALTTPIVLFVMRRISHYRESRGRR